MTRRPDLSGASLFFTLHTQKNASHALHAAKVQRSLQPHCRHPNPGLRSTTSGLHRNQGIPQRGNTSSKQQQSQTNGIVPLRIVAARLTQILTFYEVPAYCSRLSIHMHNKLLIIYCKHPCHITDRGCSTVH